MNVLVNAIAFQAGWFATVLGAANGMPWLGPVAVLLVGGLHLRSSRRPAIELRLLMIAMALGLMFDSLLLATGWITYPNGFWAPGLAPYWIVALWALFATTLNVSLRWLRGRDALAIVFGAVGGPLSYLAGARLGAMSFLDAVPALIALAVGWGALMPFLTRLAARLDGARAGARPPYIRDGWQKVDSHG
jgi:hypothetical protein